MNSAELSKDCKLAMEICERLGARLSELSETDQAKMFHLAADIRRSFIPRNHIAVSMWSIIFACVFSNIVANVLNELVKHLF